VYVHTGKVYKGDKTKEEKLQKLEG